ncbi:MAG: FkbM family methyltransferase [Rhizobiales bacterium]|nr:FkbM family methyltransferase [Hyphomicrobiales bacterium]
MPATSSPDSDLEILRSLIQKSPHLSEEFERISAFAQGKGYGAATIAQEVDMALRLLNDVPVLAIDIGGNVGDYTAELRRKNQTLEIHSFEPSATNIDKLKTRFAGDKNITIVPLAVSNASGSATLFSNQSGSGLASLTKRRLAHFEIAFDVQESIETITFEQYWKQQLNKRDIDIVKLDIEGHELAALNGFGEAIEATKVLQFEFGGCNIDTRTFFQDFWYFFKERRFGIFRIAPTGVQKIERYKEIDEFFSTTNFIAVNDRSAKIIHPSTASL